MTDIQSRKHAADRQPRHRSSLALAAAALALPGAVLAQSAATPAAPASQARGATTLPTTKVTAAPEKDNDYKADVVSSPKFTQPILDTPQTITVIKKELLQQQAATSLSEALRNTPGVTMQLGENGSTQTGDSINLIGGTADRKRVTADLNAPLAALPGSAGRLNLMAQDDGTPGRDQVRAKRWGIAPTATFGLGTATRETISVLHVQQDNRPDGGVSAFGLKSYVFGAASGTTPAQKPGPAVDPSNYYGLNSDFDHVKMDMFTSKLESDLAKGVTLRNTTRIGRTEEDVVVTDWPGGSAATALASSRWIAWSPAVRVAPVTPSTTAVSWPLLRHHERISLSHFAPPLSRFVTSYQSATLPA